MDIISIAEALKGIDYTLPKNINKNQKIAPALIDQEIRNDSLVFITEKISYMQELDISFKNQSPYAIVVNSNQKILNCSVPIIRVDSVRKAFAYACSNLHEIDYSKLKIIGITGTNGKTTTASIIFSVLRDMGYSVGFIGTGKICINERIITNNTYSMTTPDPTVLYPSLRKMQDENCEYVVMEVSSHSLELNKVSPIKFRYAIFTNLSPEHLDFHNNIYDYYKAKLSLFKHSEHGLFNLDDNYSRKAYYESDCRKSSIGIIRQGDAFATDISWELSKCSFFYYHEPNITFGIKSNLTGAFNIYNILCALKCLIDLGFKPCIVKRAIEKIENISGRMQLFSSDITVVIDYAHTPQALYNLLKSLISNNIYKQKLAVVFGCGGERDRKKRSVMGKIASEYADKIILTEDNNRNERFSDIISDIVKGIEFEDFRIIRNREIAIRTAIAEATPCEIVAIVGKGHEKYKIECGNTIPFDEESIVKDALKKRSSGDAYKT